MGHCHHSMTANVHGLLLCWNFIMSSPEPQPIKKLMMKITTKAHLYSSARTKADSEQNDENMFVSQHSSKPSVARLCFVTPTKHRSLVYPFAYKPGIHCFTFNENHVSVAENKNCPHAVTYRFTDCFFCV